ncbi:MAG: glycosyltransferase family 2 protein [Solirubrobacteraceae bacterium]
MMPSIDATVVICAYDMERWTDLRAAVDSVLAQSLQPREIVLVIDRNEPLLHRAQREFPDQRVVANQRQPGISGARNTGVEQASAEIMVFLDDDAIAEPAWLETLLAPYADEAVLGVGGRVLPLWRFGRPSWFPAEFNWVVGCSYVGLPEARTQVRNPIGASLSARRSILDRLGGFDHSMGRVSADGHTRVSGTADETELCIRATRTWPGRYWLYEPAACVHHVVPRSRLSWRFFVGRCRMEGRAKALLTEIAGPNQSLRSERRYVREVLPQGVRRGLSMALGGDLTGASNAGAIVAGTAITAAAYTRTRVSLMLRRSARRPGSCA